MTKREKSVTNKDSKKLEHFCKTTTNQVKLFSSISPSTSLEMIEYIRTLEHTIRLILAEPYGCVFCDSGKLRNVGKWHKNNCGFYMAGQFLGVRDE